MAFSMVALNPLVVIAIVKNCVMAGDSVAVFSASDDVFFRWAWAAR